MTASRRLAAGVLAVLATVLLPLGLLSAWSLVAGTSAVALFAASFVVPGRARDD